MINKRGTVLLSVIVGVMIFILGFTILNFLKSDIDTARTNLDCTNSSISDGTKLSCFGTDLTLPYAMLVILSLAGGFIFRFIQ